MTTNHIDQLKEWWDEATPGIPKTGDTYIEDERHRGSSFRIVEAAADHKYGFDNIRILARAPKPKPAWHDALAVMARCSNAPEGHREPFIRSEATHDVWIAEAGYGRTENLRDATPMIEARVTDETLARVEAAFTDDHDSFDARIRAVTAAALGLDPEPAGRSTGPHLHYDAKENA